MTTRIGFVFALGVAMGLVVAVTPAQAENRPSDGVMFMRLNGEVSRDLNSLVADGGGLSLMALDAGPGCNTVRTGATYEMHCNAAGHFCAWADGGVSCSSTIAAVTYGRPVNASTPAAPYPYYFNTTGNPTAGSTETVCVAPASGNTSIICALFRMQ